MIQRRNIAPWGIPILTAVALAACVASPALAEHTAPIPTCYPSLSAAAAQLLESYDETPLVGVYRGGTEEQPIYVLSIFVNPETGTWTITQSNNANTCISTGITHGSGGLIFDMEGLVEDSRLRNIGTES